MDFLSPPNVSSDYEATSSHSKRAHTPTSILANDKESGFAGILYCNNSTSIDINFVKRRWQKYD